ncbi:LysR family transcriptional regulator [Luteibacter sp.]|uniref:LysR family transcriptional regulator n=1 Tax=Luteibacter sp. TaxID=1886636 RepID=UPI0028090133|nr:LysR family transcriptional regulator [Luteibacter sp.]MDQ8050992.1 LysR family transcriptional regulator [Luteibacter sp.]
MSAPKSADLQAFLAVARDRSFKKASVRLGVSSSALSHTIRRLEEGLGVRLLARTTRNVSATEAGERLAAAIAPLLDQITAEVEALGDLLDKPRGTLRITGTDDSIELCIRPMLANFLAAYPEVTVELFVDYGFTDLIEERFDAGVRLGEAISKDMIAVRIGPDWRMALVASPGYFARHPPPATPHDIPQHTCVNIRHRASGPIYAWEFERDGRAFTVKAEGPLVFNSSVHVLNGALDGIGLAYVPEPMAAPHIAAGRLMEVLADWSPMFEGFHLYYPNRRNPSPAFARFVEAIRFRG